MATKTENAEIAVLQTQMKQVTETLDNVQKAQEVHYKVISEKLDALNPIPFTIESMQKRLTILENTSKKSWVKSTQSAIVGAILTITVGLLIFLIQYAITHQ